MSGLMCKTLFIDLDDTIWDFQANSKLSLRQVYDEFSLGRAFTGYEQFEKLYMTANHELWEEYHHNRVTKDFLIVERFARPFREAGSALSGDMDFIMALNHRYLDVLAQQKTLVPGAIDLLDYLTAKGYPLYILSNGFAEVQARKLQSGGIDRYFKRLILSDEIGITKPDRRLFDYALQVVGSTAADTVIVGDNYDADILGAMNAGWRAIYFNRDNLPVTGPQPDYMVTALEQLKTIL
ncbi:YjjG family noncanonical pyrimidine nucleotidase [Barnesiella sp. An22]|uniref:YjjG family noncanonical pyrimidine nucleotidase n=1 Tax=Barnesiella sp. An22 TaxID=1965590 RepID=UPI0032085737